MSSEDDPLQLVDVSGASQRRRNHHRTPCHYFRSDVLKVSWSSAAEVARAELASTGDGRLRMEHVDDDGAGCLFLVLDVPVLVVADFLEAVRLVAGRLSDVADVAEEVPAVWQSALEAVDEPCDAESTAVVGEDVRASSFAILFQLLFYTTHNNFLCLLMMHVYHFQLLDSITSLGKVVIE